MNIPHSAPPGWLVPGVNNWWGLGRAFPKAVSPFNDFGAKKDEEWMMIRENELGDAGYGRAPHPPCPMVTNLPALRQPEDAQLFRVKPGGWDSWKYKLTTRLCPPPCPRIPQLRQTDEHSLWIRGVPPSADCVWALSTVRFHLKLTHAPHPRVTTEAKGAKEKEERDVPSRPGHVAHLRLRGAGGGMDAVPRTAPWVGWPERHL